jgi:hypothetical protein
MGAINAKFAKNAKSLKYYKLNGYGHSDVGLRVNHTREVTGSSTVSPILKNLEMLSMIFGTFCRGPFE